jgi:REP element-mobilizing transposase RayT
MPRQLRIQYQGAIYHLMSRGDRREEIFRDDLDRKSFLQTLGAACQKTGWQVHAYRLMSNHFHLVVETPRANLVEGMKMAAGHIHHAFQSPTQTEWASFCRALQVALG